MVTYFVVMEMESVTIYTLNQTLATKEEEKLVISEAKSVPYGNKNWTDKVVSKYGIDQVLRGVGRPKNGG
jgi:hypothetical protein